MITNTKDIYTYDCTPREMKALPQWGAWILADQRDKNGKVVLNEDGSPKKIKLPINVKTGKAASSSDPSTWTTFEDALQKVESRGYTGLAFFTRAPVNESEPWIYGIDLDDAIDPDTGDFREWAGAVIQPREIATRLNSNTAGTVSGTGVRIYVKSRKPLPPGCSQEFGPRNPATGKTPAVEIYGRNRFFTVVPFFSVSFLWNWRTARKNCWRSTS